MEIEFASGVLTIHRVNLPVKDDWVLHFEFDGKPPPDVDECDDGREL